MDSFMSEKHSLLLVVFLKADVLFVSSDVIVNSLSDVLLDLTHVAGTHARDVLSLNEIGFAW